MLSSEQIDTISGITCNYQDYVVYYSGDYPMHFEYAGIEDTFETDATEVSDDLIIIYVGSGFTREGTTFYFGDDVSCYELTYNKYIKAVPAWISFEVPDSELVYTNLASDYPDLNFWETRFNNIDFNFWIMLAFLIPLACDVIVRVIFGGKE